MAEGIVTWLVLQRPGDGGRFEEPVTRASWIGQLVMLSSVGDVRWWLEGRRGEVV